MKVLAALNWQKFESSPDGTHHLIDGAPAYNKRFSTVLPFHAPGIAPVEDESGAYHITLTGEPLYSERYFRTFGFYFARAAVATKEGWFHIQEDGLPLSEDRYAWCGNFQQGICVVKDFREKYHHIDHKGKRLYSQSYSYAGDFRENAAVVVDKEGLSFHVDRRGQAIHSKKFICLEPFHKSFAKAKSTKGWFHIDRNGDPLYEETYAQIEPFYNGVALAETDLGEVLLIDERGKKLQTISHPRKDLFHEVSADIISYWRFFTLKSANELNIFSYLPAPTETLSKKTHLQHSVLEKLLLALQEMGYVRQDKGAWDATKKGAFLSPSHPYSLADAATLWYKEHFLQWQELTHHLKKSAPMDWFAYLDTDLEVRTLYHKTLSTYAKRDYATLSDKIDLSKVSSVADVGGGSGALLQILFCKYPQPTYHLLDRGKVIEGVKEKNLVLHPFDFFKQWPILKADVVILSRVLHDWPCNKALHILNQTKKLLRSKNSQLLVIEYMLNKENGSGGLLNLNMHVMTGSKERNRKEFQTLFADANLRWDSTISLNEVSSVMILKLR